MWKRGARDSIEEPHESSQKPYAQRFLPAAPIDNLRAWDPRGLEFNGCYHQWPGFVPYRVPCPKIDLFGKVGLHCYNLLKGTKLQFLTVHEEDTWITSIYTHLITLEAMDPIHNSSCEFVTQVRHAVENEDCLSAITTRCRLKTEEEEDDYYEWNKDAVDGFFIGDMPDWISEDALTGTDKLQYYEMKESEVEEEKEWLHLYAELALFSKWQSNLEALESAKPFEMRRIVVRTREDVESKKKVKAENAIFYICFKTRCGQDFNGIIRRTTDTRPGHFSLEVNCLV